VSKSVSAPVRIRRIAWLIIALALVLNWTTVARAQSLEDAQYDSPTATASGNPAASGYVAALGDPGAEKAGDPGAGKATASGGASKAGEGSTKLQILPATGGTLLPLIALGTLALGATGLLVLQQTSRR
jgi:hypothetical protein